MNTLQIFKPRFTTDLFDEDDRSWSNFLPSFAMETKLHAPKVDVRETKDAYIMEMELPGCKEDDVEISLKDRVLSISSKKEESKTEEKKDGEWLIRERKTSSFARRFTLPDDIDANKVEASFSDGILKIDVPRQEESKSKTIAISAKKAKAA